MSDAESIIRNFGMGELKKLSPEQLAFAKRLEKGLKKIESGIKASLDFQTAEIDTAARYLLSAGGKRIRPLLTLMTAEYGDSSKKEVILASQVVEMIHLATLYHDDVMDESELRRGVPTFHKLWGNSKAILIGDLLFARASGLAASLGEEMVRLHSKTFERLCLGQLNETIGPKAGESPVDHYLRVLADKTGSLISSSAVAGLMASGAPDILIEPFTNFGEKIGVAFQLIDDVLDLAGGETGKEKGADVRNGVATMPSLLLEAATDEESVSLKKRLNEAIRSGDEQAITSGIDELRTSVHADRTRKLAQEWAQEAISAIQVLPEGSPKQALIGFAQSVIERSK